MIMRQQYYPIYNCFGKRFEIENGGRMRKYGKWKKINAFSELDLNRRKAFSYFDSLLSIGASLMFQNFHFYDILLSYIISFLYLLQDHSNNVLALNSLPTNDSQFQHIFMLQRYFLL